MPLNSTPYYDMTCDGPGPTLRHETCPTTSEGGWNKEETEAKAKKAGWAIIGRKTLCPQHAPGGPNEKTQRAHAKAREIVRDAPDAS